MEPFIWEAATKIESRAYICGWCGRDVAVEVGWESRSRDYGDSRRAGVYVCHLCTAPTVIIEAKYPQPEIQFPAVSPGRRVDHLPEPVERMYTEARWAGSAGAWTAAAMALRNVIAYVAVNKGAEANLRYQQYVDWLEENHFLPPEGKAWVDRIRGLGNNAAHEIKVLDKDTVTLVLDFAELLLRFVYEAPGRLGEDADRLPNVEEE